MSASDYGYVVALDEARQSLVEGGIPVGSAIVGADGTLLGRGRNMRLQNGSPILHGETAAFDSNRGLPAGDWAGATLYTTLSPCPMCAGAMIWFKVKRVVIGDAKNMTGREDYLRSHGIEVIVLNDSAAIDMWDQFSREAPSTLKQL